MAGNYTIPVDVELRTKQQNVKNLRSAIENEFRDIDFNSSIGKQLNKLFNQFDTKISDMDSILGKGILDMGDLNKLNSVFNRMNLIVGQMRSSAHKAPLVDLGIDAQSVPELVEARNLVKQITSEMAKQKAVSTKDRLKQTGQQDLLDDLNKIQKTRAHENKPLGVNAKIIQDELAEAEHLIKQHYEKRDQLDKQFQEKSAKAKQSQKILDDAEADYVKNAQKASLKQIMALETAAGKKGKKSTLESQFGGGNKLSQKSAQKFLDEFMVEAGMAFEGTQISGTLTQKLWEGMFTENEITQMQQAGGDMGEALYAGLEQKLLDPTSRERFRQIVHDFSKNATGSAEGYANTADNIKKNLPNLMNQAKADAVEVQAIEQSQIDNANAIATLEPQIASFKAVVDRLTAAASTLDAYVKSQYQGQLNKANEAANQAKQNVVNQQFPVTANAGVNSQPVPQYQNEIESLKGADQFKNQLKQSISQWMGVREVIGYIKQGIRSAYQDIQGLDKAMTNIAVVTDMSTSDLWGRINEYMGVAQQYGVTTQGVYEVSQLYFQQGLGESDVMAATTETLKMARIAGMDYAEAADGMTVAIRGFNMEMSEASRVTDVYSKVAAVTASDTQELVTAMSKTASSAAAVGSSFENTTAMLAVMIEATRESPQNLGSALKSIISRYGEMTKGLSEDSEGEEIDYNRVDTALKTVGISLKDAQGQFRDFDTVIEELSAKWDTLDSVTQRYIATIFAGNRQQSRFLALVSNYDRYMEVSEAAANSEDAGLLQYSKTLDSLETKLNNIKTGFQQFYMDIFNGPVIGKFLDFINKVVTGLNKLGKLQAIFNIGSIITGIKTLVTLIIQPFGKISSVIANAIEEGFRRGRANSQDEIQGINNDISGKGGSSRKGAFGQYVENVNAKYGGLIQAGQIAGGAFSAIGTRVGADDARWGTVISGIGNTASYAAMGAQVGGIYGAVIGALAGIITAIASWPSDLEMAQQKLEKATEKAQEANIERAKAKERSTGLEETIDKLQELKKHQYDSAEAQEEFIKANNEAFERFPDLAVTFDEVGNAFINIQSAEQALASARLVTANATYNATQAEIDRIRQERETNKLETEELLTGAAEKYTGEKVNKNAVESLEVVQVESTAMGLSRLQENLESLVASGERDRLLNNNQLKNNWIASGGTEPWEDVVDRELQQHALDMTQRDLTQSSIMGVMTEYTQDGETNWETVDFISNFLGERLVTQGEANRNNHLGAENGEYTTLDENGNRTYDAISDASMNFIMRAAQSLNMADENNKAFLLKLSNMSDESQAMSTILSNYSTLKWNEGVDPNRYMAGYFGYDYDNADSRSEFFQFIGEYNKLRDQASSYDSQIEGQISTATAQAVNSILDKDSRLEGNIDSITGFRRYAQEKAADLILAENPANPDYSEIHVEETMRDTLNGLSSFAEHLEIYNLDEEVNSLFQSAESGKLSKDHLVAQLQELGINTEDELLSDYINSIYTSFDETKNNIVTALTQSPTRWTTHVTQLDIFGELDPDNVLNEIAPNYLSSITDFKNYLADGLDSGKFSQQRANQLGREYVAIWEQTTNLPLDQIAQAQQLLSEADLTTTLGKEDLIAKLGEAGITDQGFIDSIGGFTSYSENLVTQYGILQEKLTTGLKNTTEAIQGASEGIGLEDATVIAKKVGKDVTELFNFQDGQYLAKDTNALQQIYDTYSQNSLDALNETLNNQLATLSEIPAPTFSDEYFSLVNQYQESAQSWFEGLSEEQKMAEGLAIDTPLNSVEIIKAYLVDVRDDVAEAITNELNWQKQQAEKTLKINNRTHQLESAGVGMDKREAFSLLSSKGKTGYSANEIAQLETYLGLGAGGLGAIETDIGTGEYEIDLATLAGRGIPLWVSNAIKGIIEENLVSASEAIQDLGSQTAQLGGPEKGAFAAAFEKSANVLGRDFVEEYYPMMIESTVNGTADYSSQLKRIIAKELGTDVDSPEVQETYRNLISSYKDGVVEAEKEIIDLQLKAIDGSITQGEIDTLTDADGSIDVSGLIGKTQEAINSLVQRIVNNANISFDDKVSNLKQVYDAQLNDILGEETSIAGTLASREAISRSDVSSMLAELSALGVAGIAEFTESADGTGYYLENQADILAKLNDVIQSADEGSMQRKTAQNLVNQIEYMQEWQNEELPESLASTAETLSQATKVTATDVRDFYKELTGRDISLDNAKTLAREITELDPVSRLQAFIDIAESQGVEIDPERIQELANQLLDTIVEAISSGMSSLGSGLDGTLSFSDYQSLAEKYGITGNVARTSTGVSLSSSQQQQLIAGMYQEAKSQGMLTGFGDQLWATFRDSDNDPFVGYNAIEEGLATARQSLDRAIEQDTQAQQALAEAQERRARLVGMGGRGEELMAATETAAAAQEMADNTAEAVEQARAYAEALEQARAAAMLDPDAYEFTFMEQDATRGYTQNFDNFVTQIDKVKTAFSSFQSGEAIGYQDFANMMDMINNSIQRVGATMGGTIDSEIYPGLARMQSIFNEAEGGYEGFVNSVIAHTDEWGKVDIEGVALEMGISVDAAMEAMSEGMADGLKDVARQQIQYLSGVEKMLMAMQALEGVGNVELGLGVNITTNTGETVELTLYNIKDYWTEIMALSPEKKLELSYKVTTTMNNLKDAGLQSFFEGLGFAEGFDFMGWFFGPGGEVDITDQAEVAVADMFGTLAKIVPELTSGQAETFARDMYAALGESSFQWADSNGDGALDQIIGITEDFYSRLPEFLSRYDFDNIRESVMSQFETAFAQGVDSNGQFVIEFGTGQDIVFSMREGGGYQVQLPEGMNIDDPGVQEAIAQAIGADGPVQIEIGEDGAVLAMTTTPTTEAANEINHSFITAAAAADALDESIANIANTASSFQAGEQFGDLAEQLSAGAIAARELMNVFTGQEVQPPDVTALETELAAAQAAFDALAATSVPTSELDTARQRVTDIQTQLNSLQAPTGVTSGLIGELTNAIDIANRLSDALASNNGTPLEVNFNADDANGEVTVLIANLLQLNAVFQPTVKIKDEASEILNSIIDLIASVSSKTVTITTIHRTMYTSSGSRVSAPSGITPSRSSALEQWTGSINNITGPAYADGSIGRLATGTQLANKTLVGELGPELAVYDGKYHLLGESGAEFVKLPKSAIVFNHLQTAGILSGQMKNARGEQLTPGGALATGNVTGPAMAGGGIGAALSAVRRAKSVWQGLLNSLTAADLMGAGGGGGGGGGDESLKAHIADLQEWYNLSRQIADIEGQINVLLSKRKNLTDGHEYLRNLRETQRLLDDQVNTQQDLLRFQELQLQRQAEHINNNKIWSQFLEVDENGLLQYKKGNETNGGKGALEVLSQMNEMSGEEQLAFVQSLGWSYTNTDGEELEDAELVAKFYEELQKQIDDYDALRDTVQETEGTLADLEEQINEIEKEIRDNEIDLSKEIYDIIVDSWKENIENLKEQNDLIKEANEAYANGIQEAIDAERQLYDQNTAISDREKLQRQLALMRRSGGSASEIADLEQQLDDMLKEEYFSNQEKQLETIQKANERQAELMDQQVKLQEEALEYEKENGVIWAKVYDIMQGTDAEILDFISANKTDFIEQSVLQQEDMLTEWAKKIGIFTAERERQYYAKEGIESFNAIWDTKEGKTLQDSFNKADAKYQEEWKREFGDTYASAIISGKSPKEALELAQKELFEHIRNWMKAQADSGNKYAKGGIINYTGPAWVDGSKSKPERILSAEQNRILEEGLAMNAGRSDRLREMFSNFAESLGASVRASISNIANRTSNSVITIQPGAVQLNIEQLNDKYDVDELFNDVADRLYSIASKASGRGVSRR